jgi:hypothetical protein
LSNPLCIDLYAGLGGWTEGFLAEGWDVIGFDIERHVYGEQRYPAQLVLQDVRTLHGSQFRNADCIVASPPCQEFSYMAMPWSRAKQIAGALREEVPFPEGYTGSQTIPELRALFDACFRIQREASEAAGRRIPMVVENVKGAQPWVGPARANFGSFYFWGDIAMHGGAVVAGKMEFGRIVRAAKRGRKVEGFNFHQFEKTGEPGGSFQSAAVAAGQKNDGGSWFNVANSTESGHGRNPDGRKAPGNDTFAITGQPCGKLTDPRYPSGGLKGPGGDWFENGRQGQDACADGLKARRFREENEGSGLRQGGEWWHDPESLTRRTSSRSDSRKAASAQIAKIPFPLSSYIARCFKP